MKTAEDFTHWLTDQLILVYQAAQARNDIKLLHAVTSTWAFGQLLQHLDGNVFKMELLRVHLLNMLALYLIKDLSFSKRRKSMLKIFMLFIG